MKMTAMSEDGRRRPLRWWYGLIGLLAVAVVVGLFSRAPQAGTDPNDVLHEAIVRGIQDNVAKLSCAVLVWKSQDAYFGPWSDKPQGAADHQLWWDGRRTAVSCTMRSTAQDPNGHVSSDLRARFMTYNGKDFRLVELPTAPGGESGNGHPEETAVSPRGELPD